LAAAENCLNLKQEAPEKEKGTFEQRKMRMQLWNFIHRRLARKTAVCLPRKARCLEFITRGLCAL